MAQMPGRVEVFARPLTREGQRLGHPSQQLHHLGQVVVILTVLLAFARLEEEVSRRHLEDHAREGPKIGRGAVLGADNYLGRPVLSRLDLVGEVMIGPASISQIANL